MELTAKIVKKLDVVKGESPRGQWQKQEFIVETEGQYPKNVCISAWADKVEELAKFNLQEKVKLYLNPESREYNGRWYTDLRFWKIEALNANNSGGSSSPNNSSNSTLESDPFVNDAPVMDNQSEQSDDLPF